MSVFRTEVVADGDGQVVRVEGDVDLQTSPDLWQSIQQAFGRGASVRVDLRAVDYIDSSGVAILVKGLKYAGRTSAKFSLLAPSERVLAVLDLSQLTQVFSIERAED